MKPEGRGRIHQTKVSTTPSYHLSRYAPGGEFGALKDLRDERRFPGMQPVGSYAIHVIVKNGPTMLLGVVDSAADRQIAELRARDCDKLPQCHNRVASIVPRRGPATKERPALSSSQD